MLRTIFVLAILSTGLVAAVFSRYAALLLYLWFAMFRPIQWLWIDISRLRISLVVGALLVLPSLLTGVFPAVTHPLGIGSLVVLGFACLAQFDAIRPDIGWGWIDFLARLILVGLLIAPLSKTPQRVIVTIAVFAGSFLFHGVKAGLASLLAGGSIYGIGISGAFIDNNSYAVGTAMAMFLCFGAIQAIPSRAVRWPLLGITSLGTMTIVSLFSRGGLLALAAGAVVFLLLQRRRLIAVGLGIIVVAAAVLVLPRPAGYERRISPITGGTALTTDSSAISRLHFWRTAIDMALARPFGVGLFNYPEAYDQFDSTGGQYGPRRAVHNSLLQMLAETGFGGFAAYLFLFAWSLRILLRIRARGFDRTVRADERRLYIGVANGTIASIAAFLVGGSTISLALNDLTWFTFGAVIALDRVIPARSASGATPVRTSEPSAATA